MVSFLPLFLLTTLHLTNVVLAATSYQSIQHSRNASSIEWGPCDASVITNSALNCSFFEVPLDYHDPSVGYARLALAKISATGDRRGTVFLNPGGPGGSGLATLDTMSGVLSSLSGGLYDIVSWDPRGVGPLTSPGDIFCFDSPDEYNVFWNGTVELAGIEMTGNFSDPDDVRALLAQAPVMQAKYEELGRRCQRHPSGKFLRYVGTAATARDIVSLANAIDGPGSPINFFGSSYGSLLGQWLINMFPERVGRVILDGIIDPTLLATQETPFIWAFHQLANADKVFEGFFTGCALADPQGCAITTGAGQSPADINKTIQTLLTRAHDAARANASIPVTSASIREVLFALMSGPSQWSSFANATWPELVAGVQAETQFALASRSLSLDRRRRGSTNQENQTRSYTEEAILCGESVDPRGTTMTDVFEAIISASRNTPAMCTSLARFTPPALTPRAGNVVSAVWPQAFYTCPFWPVRAVERYEGPFNKTLANRVLVVSNTFDPLTPLPEAEAVETLLGDNARLIQQHAFGHTSVVEPSQCLNVAMFLYLTNGTLPDGNGTVCEVDTDFEVFPGVTTEAILAAMSSADTE